MKNNSYLLFLLCCLTAACDSGDSSPPAQAPPQNGSNQESKAELEERYREAVKQFNAEQAKLEALMKKRKSLFDSLGYDTLQGDKKALRLFDAYVDVTKDVDRLREQGQSVPKELLEDQDRKKKAYEEYYFRDAKILDREIASQRKRVQEAKDERDFTALKAFGMRLSE